MDKVDQAIERLQKASEMSLGFYKQPLIVTTSGGKDSSVCVALAERAGIPFEVMHNLTTADAPETVYFIRSEFKRLEEKGIKCILNKPAYKGKPVSMWTLIPQKKIPPTRLMRYCCRVLKEKGGNKRFISTGVRWAESVRRKNSRGIYETMPSDPHKKLILTDDNDDERKLFETCRIQSKRVVNPIIDWSDDDVWGFLRGEKVPCNPLYCEMSRVGCIGCPMAGPEGRRKQFERWPKYKEMYIKSFDRMLQARKETGLEPFLHQPGITGEDVFHWWMEDEVMPGQTKLEGV